MLKLFSLFLSFSILFTTVAPSYAQALDALNAQKARLGAFSGWSGSDAADEGLESGLERANYVAYRDAVEQGQIENSDFSQVAAAAGWIRKYGYQAFRGCVAESNKAAFEKRDKVCQGGRCVDLKYYKQGCVRVGLEELGKDADGKAILSARHTADLAGLIAEGGTYKTDALAAQGYFRELMERKEVCGVNWFSSLKQVFSGHEAKQDAQNYERRFRRPQCVSLSEGLRALAVLDVSGEDRSRNIKLIGEFLSTYAWRDYAAVVIPDASLALMAMGTAESYAELEKFLFGMHAGERALDSLQATVTPSWWVKTASALGSQAKKNGYGLYHDILSARLSYWDVDKAKQYNEKKDIDIMLQQQDWMQARYQLPQGNVIEDLGALIARDEYPLSRELAAKIVRRGLGVEDSNRVPNALLAGVLAGNGANWRQIDSGLMSPRRLLEKFYSADFTDLNEGTQRRLHEQMSLAAQHTNGVVLPEPGFDKEKFDRYNRQLGYVSAAQVADIAISAYLTATLVLSLPAWGLKGLKAVDSLASMRGVVRARAAAGSAVRGAAAAANRGLARAAEAMPKRAPAAPKQIKPLFNKPYSELNGLQRGIVNLYADVKIAADVTGQLGRAVARHPAGAGTLGTLGGAGMTGAPTSAYVAVVEQAASAAPVVSGAARTVQAANTAVKAASQAKNLSAATGVIRAPVPQWLAPSATGSIIGLERDWIASSSARAGVNAKGHAGGNAGAVYQQALGKMRLAQWKAQDQFSLLKQRQSVHDLKISEQQLFWNRQGYPLTGKFQGWLQNALENTYLYGVAPLRYMANPYYRAEQKQFEENLRLARIDAQERQALSQTVQSAAGVRGAPSFSIGNYQISFMVKNPSVRVAFSAKPFATDRLFFFGLPFALRLFASLNGGGYTLVEVKGKKAPGEEPTSAEDLLGVDPDNDPINIAQKGFMMTYETPDGTEQALPVNLTIDNRFETKGYNRITFRRDEENGFVAELRDNGRKPQSMSHFFMKLENGNGSFAKFLTAVEKARLDSPFEIKIEQTAYRPYKTKEVSLYHQHGTTPIPQVTVSAPAALVKDNARLVLTKSGQIAVLRPWTNAPLALDDVYVRLPKHEIPDLVSVLAGSKVDFDISIWPTRQKTNLLSREIPALQLGMGKTLGPEVEHSTGFTEGVAGAVSLGINNVLPGMMFFLNPLLKRYGETKILKMVLWTYVSAGAIAISTGLWGLSGGISLHKTIGLLTSFVLISLATNMLRVVNNPLIRANRGELVPSKNKKEKVRAAQSVDAAYLRQRFKEVFTKKTSQSMSNIILYNISYMFKNLGTTVFLAMPFAVNMLSEFALGVDPGFDFSLGFPFYTAYALWMVYKVYNTRLRDVYNTNNLSRARHDFNSVMSRQNAIIARAFNDAKQLEAKASVENAVKKIHSEISVLVPIESRGTKQRVSDLLLKYERLSMENLKSKMEKEGLPEANQAEVLAAAQAQFDKLEHRNVSMREVLMRAPYVLPVLVAMTLGTVHELTVSSGFSFVLRNFFDVGVLSNFITAIVLYGSMVLGRLVGNVVSLRLRSGTMYGFSSLMSLAGTGLMAFNVGNAAALIAGAIIASFGIGNFFTQMYDFVIENNPKYQREVSLLITFTMSLAGLISMPMRWLVHETGVANLDLILSVVALGASLVLTKDMFKDSSVYEYFKNRGHVPPDAGSAPQNRPGPDMNNPLPN